MIIKVAKRLGEYGYMAPWDLMESMARHMDLGKENYSFSYTDRRPLSSAELHKALYYLLKIKRQNKKVDNPDKAVLMLFNGKTGEPIGHSWGPYSNFKFEDGYGEDKVDDADIIKYSIRSNSKNINKDLYPRNFTPTKE